MWFFYFSFLHRCREVPDDLKKFGISVVDEIVDLNLCGHGVYNPGVVSYGDGFLVVHREKAKNLLDCVLLKLRRKRRNVIKITEIDSNFMQKTRSKTINSSEE